MVAFILSGRGDWIPRLVVVLLASGCLALVVAVCVRSLDQRRSGWPSILIALPVFSLPPLLVVFTHGTFLDTRSIMRILLLLIWATVAVVLWCQLDRWRRRSERLGKEAYAAIAVGVATVLLAVVPPAAGLGAVGRPQTYVVSLTPCPGKTPQTSNDEVAQLFTARGETFNVPSEDGEWRFTGVPFYASYEFVGYFPLAEGTTLENPSEGVTVTDDGSLRVDSGFLTNDPLPGYLTVLASLFSGGALQDEVGGGMTLSEC